MTSENVETSYSFNFQFLRTFLQLNIYIDR